jgi:hypothetical protein
MFRLDSDTNPEYFGCHVVYVQGARKLRSEYQHSLRYVYAPSLLSLSWDATMAQSLVWRDSDCTQTMAKMYHTKLINLQYP